MPPNRKKKAAHGTHRIPIFDGVSPCVCVCGCGRFVRRTGNGKNDCGGGGEHGKDTCVTNIMVFNDLSMNLSSETDVKSPLIEIS